MLFADMLSDTMEAYFDDIMAKSRKGVDHQQNLKLAFA